MANKSKKGFFHYLFTFVGLAFGVLCILIAILIFNPNTDVYGIGIRYNACKDNVQIHSININGTETSLSSLPIDTIKVNSTYCKFSLGYTTTEGSMKVVFKPNFVALTKDDDRLCSANINYENNALTIDIIEPNVFFALANSSVVQIILPQQHASKFANMNFEINTKQGEINLGDSTTAVYNVKSLKATTNSGKIQLASNATIKDVEITSTEKATIDVYSNITKSLKITNNIGRLNIGNLNCSVEIDNRDRLEVNAGKLNGDVKVISNNGYFTANEVKNFTKTPQLDSAEDLTNIKINTITESIDAKTDKGYVDIGEVKGLAVIQTKTGNVTLGKVNNSIDIETVSGNVTFVQNSTNITTVTTESGSINATFNQIGTSNILDSETGSITINTPSGVGYTLKFTAGNGIYQSWLAQQSTAKSGTLLINTSETTLTTIEAYTGDKLSLYVLAN